MLSNNNGLQIFSLLHNKIKNTGLEGYDPRLLWYLPFASRYYKNKTLVNNFLRRIEVALCRYIPIVIPFYLNLSKIPVVENPYGMGLLLQAYVNVYNKTGDSGWLEEAKAIALKLETLLINTSKGYLGVSVPLEDQSVSNIPAGAEVALGYIKIFEATQDDHYLNIATNISDSFINDHSLKVTENGLCIDYYSNNDGLFILNANALAMEVIYRISVLKEDITKFKIASEMFRYLEFYIRNTRYLPYAGDEDLSNKTRRVYDVYHTGFTLRSMYYVAKRNSNLSYLVNIIENKYELMKQDFVNNSNKILVKKDSKVIDIHGVAEFIRCFANFEEKNNDKTIVLENFNFMSYKDSFYYQRGIVDNKLYMPRWGHIPMMLALSEII